MIALFFLSVLFLLVVHYHCWLDLQLYYPDPLKDFFYMYCPHLFLILYLHFLAVVTDRLLYRVWSSVLKQEHAQY